MQTHAKSSPSVRRLPPATGPSSPALGPLCFYGRNWNSLPPFVGRDWIRARSHTRIGQVSQTALRSLSPGIRHFKGDGAPSPRKKRENLQSPACPCKLQQPMAAPVGSSKATTKSEKGKLSMVSPELRLCGDVTGQGISRPTVRPWRSWPRAEHFAGGRALEGPGDTRALPEKIPGHGEAPLGLSPRFSSRARVFLAMISFFPSQSFWLHYTPPDLGLLTLN